MFGLFLGWEEGLEKKTFLSPFFGFSFLLTAETETARYTIASAVNITSDKLGHPLLPSSLSKVQRRVQLTSEMHL